MENINMTDINKTNEEIILECVKKIENDNITIHNQKVSFLKNTIGFVFFTIVTTILLFCYSSTIYLERTHNDRYSFADYEKPKAAFIITSVLSSLVTVGFMTSMLGSLKHIKRKND